jgi:hypothetical protein
MQAHNVVASPVHIAICNTITSIITRVVFKNVALFECLVKR